LAHFHVPFLSSFFLISSKGGFLFAQQALPLLIETAKTNPKHPATLLFTGATASIKASIGFSAFASAKWALRALSQSLAKEFGPLGVHVGHIIADGGFDTPFRRENFPDGDPETWMSTEGMAESYWSLHIQPKRAWSWELDLRPYLVLSLFIPRLIEGKMVNSDKYYITKFKSSVLHGPQDPVPLSLPYTVVAKLQTSRASRFRLDQWRP
jgi:NAD(P)-dependent dehydrogenase (short-subunit alcohol dehydrogenase family)